MRVDAAAPVTPARAGEGLERLREAAQGFEAIFMQMLFKSMRATVKESSLFHGGRGEEVFRDLLDQALVQKTSGKGLGIADSIVGRYGALVRDEAGTGQGTRIDVRVGT
jgi:flagellar protein FlgJ